MAVVVQQAIAMDLNVVHARVAAHEADTLLKVGVVAIDPLGMVAPLGDGIEMPPAKIAWLTHGGAKAVYGPGSESMTYPGAWFISGEGQFQKGISYSDLKHPISPSDVSGTRYFASEGAEA